MVKIAGDVREFLVEGLRQILTTAASAEPLLLLLVSLAAAVMFLAGRPGLMRVLALVVAITAAGAGLVSWVAA